MLIIVNLVNLILYIECMEYELMEYDYHNNIYFLYYQTFEYLLSSVDCSIHSLRFENAKYHHIQSNTIIRRFRYKSQNQIYRDIHY